MGGFSFSFQRDRNWFGYKICSRNHINFQKHRLLRVGNQFKKCEDKDDANEERKAGGPEFIIDVEQPSVALGITCQMKNVMRAELHLEKMLIRAH